MRVINGRITSDANGEITFKNRQGTSMIDISAIHFSAFKLVKDLKVGEAHHHKCIIESRVRPTII